MLLTVSKTTIFVTIIILIVLITVYVYYNNNEHYTEETQNTLETVFKVNSCPYIVPENIRSVFEENNIKEVVKMEDVNNAKSVIYFPCTYDDGDKEIEKMQLKPNIVNRVFVIHNADEIVAKQYLWKNIVLYYGLEKTLQLMPMTYILYEQNELKRFKDEYDTNKIYILKKNVQRQEGLKLCNSLDEVLKNKNEYVLAQELLQDPYLINGRKINLRVYVLVVCYQNTYKVYVYQDGFMYYTKDLFKQGSLDFGPNITTGYVDRKVYQENPLTHEDFRKYLDQDRQLTNVESNIKKTGLQLSKYIFNNINTLIKEIFTAYHQKIGLGYKLYDQMSFQLFGVDVAIDDKLQAKIMEVNKGPDLGSKDERDGKLKKTLIKDMLDVIGTIDNKQPNGFVKVVDI